MTDRPALSRLPFQPATRRCGAARRYMAGPAALLLLAALAARAADAPAASPAPAASVPSAAPETPAETLRAEAIRHEHGEGVARDPARAAALYCSAAKLGDAVSQYNLGWMYANGRGIDRNDAWAAYFFKAASAQGIVQAGRMLGAVGGDAAVQLPDCMKDPPAATPSGGAPDAKEPARPQVRLIVPPKAIAGLVQTLAPAYGVEPQLVLAIIQAESNFDPLALSPKNAKGLMQLIPETAERFRVQDPYDPKQNIRGGLAYLRWLLAYFEGDVALVAAAYNAGERAVERHLGVPPFLETRAYVRRILAAVRPMTQFDASVVEPSPQLGLIRERQRTK